MSVIDFEYRCVLEDVMSNGIDKNDRTGTGVRSLFGKMAYYDVRGYRVPLLTLKKIHFKSVLVELLWFLTGSDNIKYLCDRDVKIWNDWPYRKFKKARDFILSKKDVLRPLNSIAEIDSIEKFHEKIKKDAVFAEKWGVTGRIYGAQMTSWRKFEYADEHLDVGSLKVKTVNQLSNVINGINNDPDSRRHVVTMWNPGELDDVVLPPCHYSFQFYSRTMTEKERVNQYKLSEDVYFKEDKIKHDVTGGFLDEVNFPKRELSVLFNIRSVDVFLGYPFDIASYGILLNLVALSTNHATGNVIISSGDTHVYRNHFDQVKKLLSREPLQKVPGLKIKRPGVSLFELREDDFELLGYESHGKIKAQVAV